MSILLALGWKSALLAGIALLISRLMRNRAATERVALLRSAVAALLLLPAIALAAPELRIVVLPALEETAPIVVSAVATTVESAPDPVDHTGLNLITLMYSAGCGALLLHLVLGLCALRRWSRAAAPVEDPTWRAALTRASTQAGLRQDVDLRMSGHVQAPLSWGVAPARILIDPRTAACREHADAVMAHELAHVRRLDWPMLLATRVAVAMFWFNPLVWILSRALARQTELAADAEAVRHMARSDYAQVLLSLAGSPPRHGACGMAARTGLGERIHSVLDQAPARQASRLVRIAMVACIPLAAPLAAMQLVRAPLIPSLADIPGEARIASTHVPTSPERETERTVQTARAARPPAPGNPARKSSRLVESLERPAGDAPSARHDAVPDADSDGTQGRDGSVHRASPIASARDGAVANRAGIQSGRLVPGRDMATDLTGAARQMRLLAQKLENDAADPGATKSARRDNPPLASSLRREAERLDGVARRARGSTGT